MTPIESLQLGFLTLVLFVPVILIWWGSNWLRIRLGGKPGLHGLLESLRIVRTEEERLRVEVGSSDNRDSWATYYSRDRIEIHGNSKDYDDNLETEFSKTVIGIDHEYLHHVLFTLEGGQACRALDKLVPNLLDHCRWTGLDFWFEGKPIDFWNNIEQTVKMR